MLTALIGAGGKGFLLHHHHLFPTAVEKIVVLTAPIGRETCHKTGRQAPFLPCSLKFVLKCPQSLYAYAAYIYMLCRCVCCLHATLCRNTYGDAEFVHGRRPRSPVMKQFLIKLSLSHTPNAVYILRQWRNTATGALYGNSNVGGSGVLKKTLSAYRSRLWQ